MGCLRPTLRSTGDRSIDETSLGFDHPELASASTTWRSLLQDTNRLASRAADAPRAGHRRGELRPATIPTSPSDLNNLAQLLQATNRLAEAEPLMRRALAIDETSFGPDHPKVAIRLNNLAPLLQATNRLAEAEPLMRRALAIDEASFGPEHPDVAIDLNNLAAAAAGHQPAGRSRAADAPRALAIDETELRRRASQRRHRASTTWPSCCRTPTGWPRPSR